MTCRSSTPPGLASRPPRSSPSDTSARPATCSPRASQWPGRGGSSTSSACCWRRLRRCRSPCPPAATSRRWSSRPGCSPGSASSPPSSLETVRDHGVALTRHRHFGIAGAVVALGLDDRAVALQHGLLVDEAPRTRSGPDEPPSRSPDSMKRTTARARNCCWGSSGSKLICRGGNGTVAAWGAQTMSTRALTACGVTGLDAVVPLSRKTPSSRISNVTPTSSLPAQFSVRWSSRVTIRRRRRATDDGGGPRSRHRTARRRTRALLTSRKIVSAVARYEARADIADLPRRAVLRVRAVASALQAHLARCGR